MKLEIKKKDFDRMEKAMRKLETLMRSEREALTELLDAIGEIANSISGALMEMRRKR